MNDAPRVLSIQSHVVHGYVGNKSATFPLQILGFEVDAINTVQFSNHSGYKHRKGPILKKDELEDLIEGLALNGIDSFSHLLSGYSRDPTLLSEVGRILSKLRVKNPDLLYVCDPVMGDDGKMYVPESILPVYRDEIVPLTDILTPNQYEAELLTNTKISSLDDAWHATDLLHKKGVKTVFISSSELGDNDNMIGLASTFTGERFTIQIPRFPAHFTGTGDLFAALILAWSHKSKNNTKFALESTIATLQEILQDTYQTALEKHGPNNLTTPNIELRLIQNKKTIENPKITIKAADVK